MDVLVLQEKNNMNDLEKELQLGLSEISNANDIHELLHVLKPKFLGKSSTIQTLSSTLKDLSIEQKRELGQKLNNAKNTLEQAITDRLQTLEDKELDEKLKAEQLDGTLNKSKLIGSIHPITKVMHDAVNILVRHGFEYIEGPEIETDWFNFSALNVGKNHPARQMQDTFYLNGVDNNNESYLLRTHTTCVDARSIISQNRKPPIALVSAGKVFRVDSDATHSPMFHQIECVAIAKDLHMGHLKYYIESFLKEFFETDNINIRLRPSYFPFTEPSAEVDVGYTIKDGKISIGGNEKYLEILGCGMLHPNVLRNFGIDPTQYQGIAFGCGIDRLTMLKYGASDIRKFFAGNLSWLKNNSFSHIEL